MNIIQVQDRLKGVTDDALVQYVENPTGEVPTYLALGEIGRRKSVRDEYQAAQAEQPNQTVAEEMIAQLSTPTGIGALTNNMGPEMPPEEVMSSSETISETGVANLPTPNMTQEFKRGGIVGDDGTIYGAAGFLVPAVRAGLGYAGRGLGFLKDKLIGTKGAPAKPGYNPKLAPGMTSVGGSAGTPGTRGLLLQPGSYVVGGVTYMLTPNGPVDEDGNPPPPEVTDTITEQLTETVTESVPEPTMEENAQKRMDLYKKFAGEDEGAARIAERMAKMEERTAGVEEDAENMMLIEAGLAMAGGKSQNFLENVVTGGKKAVESYSDSMDKVRELEKETFAIDVELNKAKRAEQLAIASKGIDSIEAQEAAERASALQAQKDKAFKDRLKIQLAETGRINEKDIIEAYTKAGGYDIATEQTLPYQQWKSQFLDSFGVEDPEADRLVDKYAS